MDHKRSAIAVHGGAGGDSRDNDGCEHAAAEGARLLSRGASALEAVVAAVCLLEDDGRYNAGYGSVLTLDGQGVEMDAAVMDSTGTLGAVACLRTIRNPVLAALEVSHTPHWLLVGEGAERFALKQKLSQRDGASPQALEKHQQLLREFQNLPATQAPSHSPSPHAYLEHWNYPMPWEEALQRHGSGTVGAVAVDRHGQLAVATSTGGCAPALLGRVGDTPIPGCGFYVGPAAAIAITGVGEAIVPRLLAKNIYDLTVRYGSLDRAVRAALVDFPVALDVGVIAISPTDLMLFTNRDMPCASALAGDGSAEKMANNTAGTSLSRSAS